MQFVAREVREVMAELGFRTLDEMIGRVDKLRQKAIRHPKGIQLDLSQLLYRQPSEDAPRKIKGQDHGLDKKLDNVLIEQAGPAIEHGQPVTLKVAVRNRDRSLGTLLSSVVAKKYGAKALPPDTIKIYGRGSAGQSFGAFLASGISLHLEGDANDYVGKGLSGGKISIRTPEEASYIAADNIIIGNVALYGATGGEAYFNGMAGERFAVRNSGAIAVVEGVGDHGCQYVCAAALGMCDRTSKSLSHPRSRGE